MTVVIIRDDLLEREPRDLPGYLNYQDPRRRTNRCATRRRRFAIYIVMLVTEWLLNDIGGLAKMEAQQSQRRPSCCTTCIDASGGFYGGHAQPDCRSLMNVTFRLPSDELTHEVRRAARRSAA